MNAACAAFFDRLVAKGKNKKLALIAVCNKLLKQAFAIVKSSVPYQADFTFKLVLTPLTFNTVHVYLSSAGVELKSSSSR